MTDILNTLISSVIILVIVLWVWSRFTNKTIGEIIHDALSWFDDKDEK